MAEFNITGAKIAGKPMVFELDINEPPPPLVLLINPETLDTKFTPKVSESRVRWSNKSSSSYILQVHHDELDTLAASGKSAMFMTNEGITSADRTRTLAYENIQQLIAIYRNNGMNFNRRPNRNGQNYIESVGRVTITYDNFVYRGSFESFSLNEVQEKPFNYEFSFEYKVTRMIDVRGVGNQIMQNIIEADPRFSR